ncbi:MAG: lactate utilization protein C [Planctomycetaceae bacterium]
MTSKDDILKSIRAQRVPPAELPSLDGPWIEYPDRVAQFAALLESVGGKCVRIPDFESINSHLARMPEYTGAKKIVSCVANVGAPNVEISSLETPHELDDVDFAIVSGEFGVCENGAVWVTDQGLRHRAIYFLAQHLAMVLPADALVDNMHQAYQKLKFSEPRFGAFLCGPSKTADIEQSLVIGAHGPRSMCVFLIG